MPHEPGATEAARHARVTDERADDYRIPDAGLHADASDAVYVDTAPPVVDVLSPDDETMEKLPFYAARGVTEVVVVDPDERSVTWFALADGRYLPSERSEVLDLEVAAIAAAVDWPQSG